VSWQVEAKSLCWYSTILRLRGGLVVNVLLIANHLWREVKVRKYVQDKNLLTLGS